MNPLFKSSDAVFRMAFSTIMLNTDLHNPGMKEDKRMTLEDFIKNNRGLNDDSDFPREFLEKLYDEIKANEFEMQKEFLEVLKRVSHDEITAQHWEEILKRQTEAAFFTTAEDAHQRIFQPDVHDRDMFVSIAKSVTLSLSKIFVKSIDDALIIKCLKCFKDMAKICVFFDLDETFNELLQILLGHGRDYIMSCIAMEYSGDDGEQMMATTPQVLEDNAAFDEDETQNQVVLEGQLPTPIPEGVLAKSMSYSHVSQMETIEGSAAHRGLLALDSAFTLVRTQPARLREAWPALVECLCALRDARALPDRVIFLDDFADSRGNLLPLSPFAKQSQRRLDDYYKGLSSASKKKQASFFGSFFAVETKPKSPGHATVPSPQDIDQNESELSLFAQALLHVTKRAKLDQVVMMRPKNLPMARQTLGTLLDSISSYPYFDDPIFEQHAVYSLELALLALIANKDRVTELYPIFLEKFEAVLESGIAADRDDPSQTNTKNVPTPFLMERVVVTILRSCIHLYDIPEIRPQLRLSLDLLIGLPTNFTRFVADRIACGMAIFLALKYFMMDSTTEWTFVHEMMDKLSFFGPARGFIFDGIANTVESQLTPTEEGDEKSILTLDGSTALSKLLLKFVFGTYQKDMSLCIPAMLCLENLYRHTVMLQRNEILKDSDLIDVPDQELWQNVAVAYYSVCRSPDAATSRQGTDCFQRFIASTKRDSLPDDTWLTMLHLIVMKQPPVRSEDARVNCCTILGKVLLMTIAHLSENKENWEDLTDIVNQMAVLTGENLREGRRGSVSPLFESTLQSITFLSNHMVSGDFTGDKEYGAWVSDTLLSELEKVGAGGGALQNIQATQRN